MENLNGIFESKIENHDELVNLAYKCFHKSEVNGNWILSHITSKKCIMYVIDNIITGFLLYSSNIINYICVDPEYRKRGIATSLINKIKHKKDKLTLYVRISNINAISLYRKMGFTIKCKKDDYYKFTEINEDGYEMEWKKKILF